VHASEILQQLDDANQRCSFPNLENGYYYAVDVRLHAYRDDSRWALIIEAVGYSPRAAALSDVLHYYGNCLTSGEPGFENEDFLDRIDNWHQIEDREFPEEYQGGPIVIRGQSITVPGEPGEELYEVFRRLVPEHRDLLFATEDELRRRIPADLPKVLQLEEWHHPDVSVDELPSGSPTFQELAEVLSTGDTGRYDATRAPNTHWTNWPESGSL
jgi:uncharacterized protein DUF7003